MRITFAARQVGAWRGKPPGYGSSALFKAPWDNTVRLLHGELDHLADRLRRETKREPEAIIELNVRPNDIRMDGQLRGDARPTDNGVAVILTTPTKTLRFQTSRYNNWRHNVRAIALALEALRAVDRHGVTDSGEQYTGFAALPAGEPGLQNADQAAAYLCFIADEGEADRVRADPENYGKSIWRKAVLKAHPDQGGAADTLRRVNRAAEMLLIR